MMKKIIIIGSIISVFFLACLYNEHVKRNSMITDIKSITLEWCVIGMDDQTILFRDVITITSDGWGQREYTAVWPYAKSESETVHVVETGTVSQEEFAEAVKMYEHNQLIMIPDDFADLNVTPTLTSYQRLSITVKTGHGDYEKTGYNIDYSGRYRTRFMNCFFDSREIFMRHLEPVADSG